MPSVVTADRGYEPKIVELEVGQAIRLDCFGYESATSKALILDLIPIGAPVTERWSMFKNTYKATLLVFDSSIEMQNLMNIREADVVTWYMRPFMVTHEN
jgi:hypothetical protein